LNFGQFEQKAQCCSHFKGLRKPGRYFQPRLPLGTSAGYVPEWEFLYTRFSGAC
jgi:hypothetical protein